MKYSLQIVKTEHIYAQSGFKMFIKDKSRPGALLERSLPRASLDSLILNGGDGWIQGYNCQAAVDGDHQVIVAIDVNNQSSDSLNLRPMLERIAMNTGQRPGALIADASYCSTANLGVCER